MSIPIFIDIEAGLLDLLGGLCLKFLDTRIAGIHQHPARVMKPSDGLKWSVAQPIPLDMPPGCARFCSLANAYSPVSHGLPVFERLFFDQSDPVRSADTDSGSHPRWRRTMRRQTGSLLGPALAVEVVLLAGGSHSCDPGGKRRSGVGCKGSGRDDRSDPRGDPNSQVLHGEESKSFLLSLEHLNTLCSFSSSTFT